VASDCDFDKILYLKEIRKGVIPVFFLFRILIERIMLNLFFENLLLNLLIFDS